MTHITVNTVGNCDGNLLSCKMHIWKESIDKYVIGSNNNPFICTAGILKYRRN